MACAAIRASLRHDEIETAKLRAGWAAFLSRHEWHQVVTLTFDRSNGAPSFAVNPQWVDRAFRGLICSINERTYGKRWLKTSHKGVVWVRAFEAHRDGVLHAHVLLRMPNNQATEELSRFIRSWWRARYGFSEAEIPRAQEDVIRYLVKHAGDSLRGEFDLSHNFGCI